MTAASFYISYNSVQFLHLLINMCYLFFFLLYKTHPDRRGALFYGLFHVHFLDNERCWTPFIALWTVYACFGEMSFKVFGHYLLGYSGFVFVLCN